MTGTTETKKETHKKMKKWIFLLFLGFAMVATLSAQLGQTGSIRGTITDAQKAPLPGATITVTSTALMGKQSVVSGADGSYRFPPILPPGTYTIVIELQGFNSIKQEGVIVRVGMSVELNFEMAQAAINQEVTVTAASPVVDVVSSKVAQNATTQIIESLPFSNRDVWTFAATTAAGTRGTSIHDGSSPTYTFSIDGIQSNASDQNYPENSVDMETVEEVEFLTAGITAESYGSRSGYMNVVTKSGGNDFHGAAQVYYTGEKLQQVLIPTETLAALGLPKPTFAFYDYDFSATLGGPIIKDKIWFFGSFKYYSNKNHVNFIPTTIEGTFYGPYERVETRPYEFGKLTIQVSKSLKFFGTFSYVDDKIPHYYTGAQLTASASAINEPIQTMTSEGLTWVVNPETIVDVRGGFYTQDWTGKYTPEAVPGPKFTDSYTSYVWGNRGMQEYTWKSNYDVNVKLLRYQDDFLGGNHEFRAGAEYVKTRGEWGYWRDNPIDWTYYNGNRYYYRGLYGLTGPHPLYGDGSLTFNTYGTKRGDSQNVGVGNRLGGFIQDTMTIKERLSITVGVRYDWIGTDIPTQVKGAAGGTLGAAIGAATIQPTFGFNPYLPLTYEGWNNAYPYHALAPNIGVTYDLFGTGKTAVKLHWGTYYDPAATGTWSGLQPSSPVGFTYYWTDLNGNGQPDAPPIDNYVLPGGTNPTTMLSTTFKKQIDQNLKDPYTSEITAMIEHELFPQLKVSAMYIYRDRHNLTANLFYDQTSGTYWNRLELHPEWWVPFTTTVPAYGSFPARNVTVYYRSNNAPLTFNVLTNVPQQQLYYSGFEFSFDKRMHDGWSLGGNFNYAYQWSNGSFTNPNTRVNTTGRGNVPWWVKLYGTFNIPYGFVASFIYLHTEGGYWGRSVTVAAPTAWITANNVTTSNPSVTIEPPDTRRLVSNDSMSLRVEKEFIVRKIGRFGLFVDIFNLFGATYPSVTSNGNPAGTWRPVDNNSSLGTYTPGSLIVTGVSGVRTFKLSFRYAF